MTAAFKTKIQKINFSKATFLTCSFVALSACENGFDFDLRGLSNGFSTSQAAQNAINTQRPEPDANGVISYPNYQAVLAKKNETVSDIANRLKLSPMELGRYNGIAADLPLRAGEIIALPRRVGQSSSAALTPSGTIESTSTLDISEIATTALDSVPETQLNSQNITRATPSNPLSGLEPTRHQVQRGETAYSIARKYDIPVRSLAQWNSLDSDLSIQEGRYLLIPVKAQQAPQTNEIVSAPPSASKPLPSDKPVVEQPKPSINLGASQTDTAPMSAPVSGNIIRDYDKNKSKFVLFAADKNTAVKAAKEGTVKLISTNADGVQIMVIDHQDGLQTGYSFIEGITVKKGDKVSRGQKIATVAENEFGALQFMAFKGTQTVDPTQYLK